MNNRTEIIPGIYIAKKNSLDNSILNEISGIKKVIDTETDLSFIGKNEEYNHEGIRRELKKYEIAKTIEYFKDCANTIHNNYLKNTPLIVTCDECDQLSPSVVLYYLVHYAKIPIDYAVELIKSKNSNVFRNGVVFYSLIK